MGLSFFSIKAQENGAEIVFKHMVIDYGTIVKNSDGVRSFEFTNTGDEPLEIFDVKSTIGCTIVSKPTAPIKPGVAGELIVKYDTSKVHPFRKTITVISNANKSIIVLKIKGSVVASELDL
jgi:hypothetical protein